MITFQFLSDPDAADLRRIITLYREAEWWGSGPDDPDLVRRIVIGSHCFVLARRGTAIVGMGRAISDGASDAWIQDVTVSPDFRRRGIASEIVRRIVERLESDGLMWIGLVAERNTAPLYGPLGFESMADALPMRWKTT
jgi:ribosomal protein S18 acetylase RimI-like enzyme